MKKNFFLVVLLGLMLGLFTQSQAQTYHNLSTGSFSQNWTNTGLITTNDSWTGVPSIIGYRGDNATLGTGVDPQTLLDASYSTVVDVNANQTLPNTFSTGGVTEFEITDPVVALTGSSTADAPNLIFYMNSTGVTNVTVQFNLRDIDGSTDNSIQQIALQYRTTTTGSFTNVAAGYVADASSGPSLATLVTPINVTLPSDADNQATLEIRVMTTNAVGNDEWIGVDDIVISGTSGALTPPTLTPDVTNNDVDHDIDITFTDNSTWRAAVTAVKVNGTTLGSGDYTLTAGNLKLIPSNLNTVLTTSGSKSVSIEATNYSNAGCTQEINAGALSATQSTATIASPLVLNSTRTVTCTAKDQYGNAISSYNFKYDATVTNNNLTTGESYTIDGVARTASVFDINLTTTTNTSGVATFTIVIPAAVDANDGVSVQVQGFDGLTNIGTAFSYLNTPPVVTLTGTDPTTNWFNQGISNNILYRIQVDVVNDAAALNSLNLTLAGTYTAADIAANGIKLRYSTNNILETSDPTIGTGLSSASTGSGEVLSFTGLTQSFNIGTAYIFVTANIEGTAVIGHTISGQTTANGDFTFSNSATFGTGTFGSPNLHSIAAAPVMNELVIPKYMGGKTAASANNARTPLAFCISIDNLLPNTAYDIRAGIALDTNSMTITSLCWGAGNIWLGSSFTTGNLTNVFTTDGSGSSGPFWIYIQPTGNASRFGPGQVHDLRIGYTVTGGTMPATPNFASTKTITALDIATTAMTTETTDDGAFIKGSADPSVTGKYVLIYDNTAGTGDPLFSYMIRQAIPTNTSQSQFPQAFDSVYTQSGSSAIGDWPAIVPIGANNPNGIRRVEGRNADNTIFYANTDDDGIWPSGFNSTTLARRDLGRITATDAPLVNLSKTLNLTFLLQGLYNGGGLMNQAMDEFGPHFPGNIADTVSVLLHDGSTGLPVYTAWGVNVTTAGNATAIIPATYGGFYWLTIAHRNSIATASSVTVSFSGSVINYDFTTPADAYGANMYQTPDSYYTFYSGDVNMDGFIDSGDFSAVDNDVANFVQTYTSTDVTGDSYVDTADFTIIDNNNLAFVTIILPY